MTGFRYGFAMSVALWGCGSGGDMRMPVTLNTEDLAMQLAKVNDLSMPPVHDLAQPAGDMVLVGPCDPIAQDCADPANKCTTVADPNDPTGMTLLTQCVQITGSVGLNQSCVRSGDADAGATATAGHDNCAKGFFCSSDGSLVSDYSERHCRSFCQTDQSCNATPMGKCIGLIPQGDGLCSPSCTLFGTDCAKGLDCSSLNTSTDGSTFVPTCRGIGKLAVGKSCTLATDCIAGVTCISPTMGAPMVCVQLCDDNNPCPGGLMCGPAMGLPNGGGVCE